MRFFDAIDEQNSLIEQGHDDAIHLEVIDFVNRRRHSVVFKDQAEADNFIKFNGEYFVDINVIPHSH